MIYFRQKNKKNVLLMIFYLLSLLSVSFPYGFTSPNSMKYDLNAWKIEMLSSILKNLFGNCPKPTRFEDIVTYQSSSDDWRKNILNLYEKSKLKPDSIQYYAIIPSKREFQEYYFNHSLLSTYSFANHKLISMLNHKYHLNLQVNLKSMTFTVNEEALQSLSAAHFTSTQTKSNENQWSQYLPWNHFRNQNFDKCLEYLVHLIMQESIRFSSAPVMSDEHLNMNSTNQQPLPAPRKPFLMIDPSHREILTHYQKLQFQTEKYFHEFHGHKLSYFMIMKNIILFPNGFILSSCGYWIPLDENCEFLSCSEPKVEKESTVSSIAPYLQSVVRADNFTEDGGENIAGYEFSTSKYYSQSLPIAFNQYQELFKKCQNTVNNLLKTNQNTMKSVDKLWEILSSPMTSTASASLKRIYYPLVAACSFQSKLFSMKMIHEEVIVINALWDYNYYHFLLDSMTRISYFIPILKMNPKMKIFIRQYEDTDPSISELNNQATSSFTDYLYAEFAKVMRNRIFEMFGISSNRIISQLSFAKRAIVPRSSKCGEILSNPFAVRELAIEMISASTEFLQAKQQPQSSSSQFEDENKYSVLPYNSSKPNLMILHRYASASRFRTWTHKVFDHLLNSLAHHFPSHNVMYVSSLNITNKDYCYACSIQQFQRADILIGFHGAGLSNMMFMPKNAIIVEVIDTFNDVNLPLCGYYHNLARIFEHHYYYFGYHRKLNENLPVRSLIQKMKEFYDLVHSPSQSAGLQDSRKD